MHRSESEPVGTCACGRTLGEAATATYRSSGGVYRFRRCECGHEWTQVMSPADLSEPIISDEVLEVHLKLADWDGSLERLLGINSLGSP